MEYRQFTKKEKEWLTEFERVMKKAPSSLFMFVGTGITVFAKDKNGQRYMKPGGGVDGDAPNIGIITNMEYDGGDY